MFPLTLFSRLCICTFFFLLGVSIAYATPMMSPMLPPIINDCSVGPTVVGRRPARDRLLPDCLYLRTVLFCGCVWISLPVFCFFHPFIFLMFGGLANLKRASSTVSSSSVEIIFLMPLLNAFIDLKELGLFCSFVFILTLNSSRIVSSS